MFFQSLPHPYEGPADDGNTVKSGSGTTLDIINVSERTGGRGGYQESALEKSLLPRYVSTIPTNTGRRKKRGGDNKVPKKRTK